MKRYGWTIKTQLEEGLSRANEWINLNFAEFRNKELVYVHEP
jgi:hypothetical protein